MSGRASGPTARSSCWSIRLPPGKRKKKAKKQNPALYAEKPASVVISIGLLVLGAGFSAGLSIFTLLAFIGAMKMGDVIQGYAFLAIMIFPIFRLPKIIKNKICRIWTPNFDSLKLVFFLACVQKIRARLQELLQKRPIIPPQQINVSSCQS